MTALKHFIVQYQHVLIFDFKYLHYSSIFQLNFHLLLLRKKNYRRRSMMAPGNSVRTKAGSDSRAHLIKRAETYLEVQQQTDGKTDQVVASPSPRDI